MGANAAFTTPSKESYRILLKDGRLLFGGETLVGARHAMYSTLRKLGCDWVMPGPEGEVIPQSASVTLDVGDESSKPDWEVRAPWYSGGTTIVNSDEVRQFTQWLMRMQQNAHGPKSPRFLSGGHFWETEAKNSFAEALKNDPEMYALIRQPDGTMKRRGPQLDTSNPKLYELIEKWVHKQYENRPKDATLCLNIGPADGNGFSQDPQSVLLGSGRMDPLTGDNDNTDLLVAYTNKLLEKLVPEYPNLYLGWYLYCVYADYPMKHKPHPHLALDIADITQSRYHSTLDRSSPSRIYYKGVLDQWGKLAKEQGNPLWYYGYNWNLSENLMPYQPVVKV